MVAATKGTRMNSKAIAALASLWLPVVASATEGDATSKLDSLSQKLEKILATQGISFGGQFRAELGASDLSGAGQDPSRRSGEQIGYTSVDFDLRARPNTLTQGRAVFRMHLDDASFFGAPYTPIETRWLSLDGNTPEGMFYYHLGSYQQKWSPLTLWSPDPSFVYTPRIFAQQQKQAMDERFLGNNVRNLQGANMGFRAAVPKASIDSFNVSLLAAKLLTGAPIGYPNSSFIGQYNISGDGSSGYPDSLANYDRWVVGGRGVITVAKGATGALSFLLEKDLKSTYGSTDGSNYEMNIRDSAATPQNGRVVSGQIGVDASKFMANPGLILGLDAEVANSSWDYYDHGTLDTNTGDITSNFKAKSGLALNAALKAGWKGESWSAKAMGGFLSVDSNYRADLAQTRVFNSNMGRIYNSEQDAWNGSSFTNLIHYNTFDALYHNVHHWVAESQSPQNEVAKIPYDKLAYSNYVAGWATTPFGAWNGAVNAANTNFSFTLTTGLANLTRYDSIRTAAKDSIANKHDSLVALVNLGTAVGLDSARLGYKTFAQGIYSDSSLARARRIADSLMADSLKKYSTTVKSTKMALYQIALFGLGLDRDLQMMLPGGEATPNRVGPKFSLESNLVGGAFELLVNAYALQEVKGTALDSATDSFPKKASFTQVQAGGKLRIDRLFPNWNRLLNPKTPQPLELSLSAGQSTAKGGTWLDYTSTQVAASAYVGLLPRLAFVSGLQMITGKDKSPAAVDRNEEYVANGLEFKVQEGAYFQVLYGKMTTKYPNAPEFDFDQDLWSTKISVSF
jgi:hypothetical protein